MSKPLPSLLWAALLALTACTAGRPVNSARQTEPEYCVPPVAYRYDPATAPLPGIAPLLDSALTARFPRRSLLVANAAGALPQLRELVRLEAQARPAPGNTARALAVLAQRQRIGARLQLLAAAIASVAAELDCEGERADQVAGYLNARADRRGQRLTVLSIGVGAVSGVGTTVSGDQATQYIFGIGGGLLTAGLGLLTLSGHRTVPFVHPRNLLADVWREAPTSEVYPPGVWYLLTEKAFSNRGENSVAHNTRLRWQRYGELNAPESRAGRQQQALFLGDGGQYEADDLTVRANMLNELQSSVRLMNQELQGLLLSLDGDAGQ